MLESFITAFIIYFVVIDPIGNAPVFLAVTSTLKSGRRSDYARKLHTKLHLTNEVSRIYHLLCSH